jgi:hypothetical protein
LEREELMILSEYTVILKLRYLIITLLELQYLESEELMIYTE